VNPTFRADIESIAASEGGKIAISADVLIEMFEGAEQTAYLDGAVWVIEQIGSGRSIADVLGEVRGRLDERAAWVAEQKRALETLGVCLKPGTVVP
jgi:hypothetical protein